MIPADEFYAGLYRVIAASGAFITDPADRVLLVKPNYRDHWGWPGGHVDDGEAPEAGCAREVKEELGLELPVGRLLTVHWVPELTDRPYALVHFMFDCGTLPNGDSIVLQEEELDAYGFFTAEQAAELLPPHLLERFTASQRARRNSECLYLSGGPQSRSASRP
ncbi:NUDIX domain-containing protein [Acrocarpospora macrocephala]|uniref:NUDIX domain-containing protein n=1 Tax=Acrocarpospora macrocephala TaxID=150177 RepID=UPI001C3FF60A|nr:NUDIX hydrolase [Acrocarpospora macrocephala]